MNIEKDRKNQGLSQKEYADNIIRKPVRTKAGVTPLTVVCEPRKCNHGTCIYCPGGDNVPQSYTDKSPAVMRAMKFDYNSKEQVESRLKSLKAMHHPTDKIELIIIGGTFLQYPDEYKYNFIKGCYDALNETTSKTLEEAKKLNEKAKHRCVALCIENRPDDCSKKQIQQMLSFGTTRVEIGVQIPDDEIYRKTNRGHTVQDVINATRDLRNAGFKVGYHFMPGLPYSNKEKDIKLFKWIFSNPDFRPDQLKLYPCQIIKDSPLEKVYKKINYTPYTTDEIKEILKQMYIMIPNYCRVMRIMRQIPPDKIIQGTKDMGVRGQLEKDLRKSSEEISEIRMREAGMNFDENMDRNIKIIKTEYEASGAKEIFLECINNEGILFGLLRLRLTRSHLLDVLKDAAIVRELHVYGNVLNLGEKSEQSTQHKGIGKLLMAEAEKISKENNFKKISVISGIGVREYYKKLGYKIDKEEIYMEKLL